MAGSPEVNPNINPNEAAELAATQEAEAARVAHIAGAAGEQVVAEAAQVEATPGQYERPYHRRTHHRAHSPSYYQALRNTRRG